MAKCSNYIVFLLVVIVLCSIGIYLEGDSGVYSIGDTVEFSRPSIPVREKPKIEHPDSEKNEEIDHTINGKGTKKYESIFTHKYFVDLHEVLSIFRNTNNSKHLLLVLDTSELPLPICKDLITSAKLYLQHFNFTDMNATSVGKHEFTILHGDFLSLRNDFATAFSKLEKYSCKSIANYGIDGDEQKNGENLLKRIYSKISEHIEFDEMNYVSIFSSIPETVSSGDSIHFDILSRLLGVSSSVSNLGISFTKFTSKNQSSILEKSREQVNKLTLSNFVDFGENIIEFMNASLSIWTSEDQKIVPKVYMKADYEIRVPADLSIPIPINITFTLLSDINTFRGYSINFKILEVLDHSKLSFFKPLSGKAKRVSKNTYRFSGMLIPYSKTKEALLHYEFPKAFQLDFIGNSNTKVFNSLVVSSGKLEISKYSEQFPFLKNSNILICGPDGFEILESFVLTYLQIQETSEMVRSIMEFMKLYNSSNSRILETFRFPLHNLKCCGKSTKESLPNRITVLRTLPNYEEYDESFMKLFHDGIIPSSFTLEEYKEKKYKVLEYSDNIDDPFLFEKRREFDVILYSLPDGFQIMQRIEEKSRLLNPIQQIKKFFKPVPTIFLFTKTYHEEENREKKQKLVHLKGPGPSRKFVHQKYLRNIYKIDNHLQENATFLKDENSPHIIDDFFVNPILKKYLEYSFIRNSSFNPLDLSPRDLLNFWGILKSRKISKYEMAVWEALHFVDLSIQEFRDSEIERFCENHESLCYYTLKNIRENMEIEIKDIKKKKKERGEWSLFFKNYFSENNRKIYDSETLYYLDTWKLSIFQWIENLRYYDYYEYVPFVEIFELFKTRLAYCRSNFRNCWEEFNTSMISEIRNIYENFENSNPEVSDSSSLMNISETEKMRHIGYCSKDVDYCYCLIEKYFSEKGSDEKNRKIFFENVKRKLYSSELEKEGKNLENEKKQKSEEGNKEEEEEEEEEDMKKLENFFYEDERKQVFLYGKEYDDYLRYMKEQYGEVFVKYREKVDNGLELAKYDDGNEFDDCILGENYNSKYFFESDDSHVRTENDVRYLNLGLIWKIAFILVLFATLQYVALYIISKNTQYFN